MKTERVKDKPIVRLSEDLRTRVALAARVEGMNRNEMLETYVMLGMSAHLLLKANSASLQASNQ